MCDNAAKTLGSNYLQHIAWPLCRAMRKPARVRNAVHSGLVFQAHVSVGCISIIPVTAAYGSALTAGHLEKPQVTKGSCPFRSVPR
jgi:hypothetical protein